MCANFSFFFMGRCPPYDMRRCPSYDWALSGSVSDQGGESVACMRLGMCVCGPGCVLSSVWSKVTLLVMGWLPATGVEVHTLCSLPSVLETSVTFSYCVPVCSRLVSYIWYRSALVQRGPSHLAWIQPCVHCVYCYVAKKTKGKWPGDNAPGASGPG